MSAFTGMEIVSCWGSAFPAKRVSSCSASWRAVAAARQLGGVGRRASGAEVWSVAVQPVEDRIAHEGLTSRFPRERYPLDLRPVLV